MSRPAFSFSANPVNAASLAARKKTRTRRNAVQIAGLLAAVLTLTHAQHASASNINAPEPSRGIFDFLFRPVEAQPSYQKSASQAFIIDRDLGGNIYEYKNRAQQLAAQRVQVVIRGDCQSACSFFLGVPKACVEPEAVIKLHAAIWTASLPESGIMRGEIAPGPTRTMLRAYPPRLQRWIGLRGGLTRDWLVLEKQELLAMFPRCGKQG